MNGGRDPVSHERLRVRLRLVPGADPEVVLAAAEAALGRPLKRITRLRTIPVLSVLADRAELDALSALPGVEEAAPEGRSELPPRPVPRQERE